MATSIYTDEMTGLMHGKFMDWLDSPLFQVRVTHRALVLRTVADWPVLQEVHYGNQTVVLTRSPSAMLDISGRVDLIDCLMLLYRREILETSLVRQKVSSNSPWTSGP